MGLNRDTGVEDFIFDFDIICHTAEKLDVTKRNTLRVAAMFFEPLGLKSPIKLQPKLIFEGLCRNKLEWDKVINDRNNDCMLFSCHVRFQSESTLYGCLNVKELLGRSRREI